MRAFAESNGDSVVCIEDDDVINLHVHTADPGKILSEAIKYGYLTNFKIENMHEQFLARQKQGKSLEKQASAEKKPDPASEFIYAAVDPSRDYGFVAVAAGEGLKAVFTDLSADAVVSGGQTMNPATEDILAAVQSVPAKTVFVLPNNKNIIMAAQAAAELASREVVVIPTKTVPQGISAMLSFDAAMEPSENEAAMTDCLSGVMTMQITYAARDSDFDGFDIHAGDYLGLCDGALAGTAREITTLLASLADKAAEAGKEFINIFYGADIQEPDAEAALELFRQHAPDAEVNLVSGGQPIYYYLISAE